MKTASQKAARDKYDDAHMAYQTVKVRKNLLEEFRRTCQERGDRVNTVLREAMESYIKQSSTGGDPGESTAPE